MKLEKHDQPPSAEVEDKKISLRQFLEAVHPSIAKDISGLWTTEFRSSGGSSRTISWPDIRLHCKKCEGERTFRCATSSNFSNASKVFNTHPQYICGDCNQQGKHFALRATPEEDGSGSIYKYGEMPAFGIPVSNRILRLFGGEDAKIFLKGRQCENLGYGIGAFAYYRRVVENHKNDLFNEIIKVCETVGAADDLINELKAAKNEISFSKSLEQIKTALPQGLLINGHNPLHALHGALSIGLHNESDDDCLASAQAVRLVLSDLVERIAMLKQDNHQLNQALQLLLAKR
ncbi:hypothetical protein [Rhizobium sp. PL01]|uniref:hypothetical protein n=1 Tax=Rhizobium sp. PL01 TaxID=3085631 RepID=UPI002981119C|nr:hypothetical protein [Rhizobium sp. PL01]MDW5315366.1 hypothetical protein [Rhizobium sp. PL01]